MHRSGGCGSRSQFSLPRAASDLKWTDGLNPASCICGLRYICLNEGPRRAVTTGVIERRTCISQATAHSETGWTNPDKVLFGASWAWSWSPPRSAEGGKRIETGTRGCLARVTLFENTVVYTICSHGRDGEQCAGIVVRHFCGLGRPVCRRVLDYARFMSIEF